MARRAVRGLIIAGVVGAAIVTVSYLASSVEIDDVKLISIDAVRLKDIAQLKGEALPETPVFRVRFSTRSDLVALADQLDSYTIRNRVLVGDAGCNPALKTITYTRVAFMLLDFSRVYDGQGNVEDSAPRTQAPHDYVLYFGIVPSEMSEFASSGIKEAPLCFELTGESRVGRSLSSNLVLLPMDALAEAAARLGS